MTATAEEWISAAIDRLHAPVVAVGIRRDTEDSYPRILAAYGASYAAGWLAARNHIADQLEASQ